MANIGDFNKFNFLRLEYQPQQLDLDFNLVDPVSLFTVSLANWRMTSTTIFKAMLDIGNAK